MIWFLLLLAVFFFGSKELLTYKSHFSCQKRDVKEPVSVQLVSEHMYTHY